MANQPENAGVRLELDVYVQRIVNGIEQPVVGPLAAEYVGASPQTNRETVLDRRRGKRAQVLHVTVDGAEPSGKLTFLSTPKPILAMILLGTEQALSISGGSVTGEAHRYTPGFGVQLDQINVGNLKVYGGAYADLDVGVVGNNNALTLTAVEPGTDGNNISLTVVDPAANNASLGVSVNGTAITVNLATDGGGAITSTAAQIRAALAANAQAAALVSVANTGASDGSGNAIAVAITPLAGGDKTSNEYTVDTDFELLDSEEGIIRPLIGGAMSSGMCFVDYDHGAVTGTTITVGSDIQVNAKIRGAGVNNLVNDDGVIGAKVRFVSDNMQLTPAAEINLAGTEAIKAEFDALPVGPVDIQYPTFAAV